MAPWYIVNQRMSMWIDDISKAKTPLRFFFAVSRPYVKYAIIASLFVIGASLLNVFNSYIFKQIVDYLTAEGAPNTGAVWMWAIIYIVAFTVQAGLWRLSGFAGMRWTVGMRATATHALAAHVTKHSTDFFHSRFAGAIGGKVGNASQAIKTLAERYLWSQLDLAISLVAGTALTFYANAIAGYLFVGWLVVVVPVTFYLARKRIPLSSAAQYEDTRVRARIIDTLTNIGAVHDFARRTFELDALKHYSLRRYRAGIRNWTVGEINRIISNIFQGVFVAAIVCVAMYAWSMGLATAGDVVLVLTLIVSLAFRIEELGKDLNDFAEHYGEVKEGLDELLDPYKVVDVPHGKRLRVSNGKIEFTNVSFLYNEGSRSVISDFSLSIQPGQKVGLVGKSGAGKSTLIKLLLRSYDLTGGTITIDDQNIAEVGQESLREAIAVVPQEPLLFHRTIKENILYGKLTAVEGEMQQAARAAQAHAFIDRLPQKYDTLVGERGVKLSGGERQRIAIARAIIKDAPILVLDEATSSLDSESEKAIQQALHSLMEGKTVIAVAHRLSTLREMDRIVVLDGGKIIEDGSHDELIKKKGLYSELWSHQSGGYLQDE